MSAYYRHVLWWLMIWDFQLTCRNSNKLSATSVSLAQSAENNTTRCSCRRQVSTYRDKDGKINRQTRELIWASSWFHSHEHNLCNTCSSCCGLKQKKGRWRSKSIAGWSLSSLDGNTMVRGRKVNICKIHTALEFVFFCVGALQSNDAVKLNKCIHAHEYATTTYCMVLLHQQYDDSRLMILWMETFVGPVNHRVNGSSYHCCLATKL